jgi:glycosyltransferase involved in cell wall biosynthesis
MTPQDENQTGVLYISYDGMLDGLGQSQVFPYLERLTRNGYRFHLLSFEKPARWQDKNIVNKISRRAEAAGIRWIPLRYLKRPPVLSTLLDAARGAWQMIRLLRSGTISIVHVRSYVPALIVWLARPFCPKFHFLFDIRGLWVDERVDGGLWAHGGTLFKIGKRLEKRFFSIADHVVTLAHASVPEIQKIAPFLNESSISVIRTAVDFDRFTCSARADKPSDPLRIVYLGKIGTWYMLDEMIRFFTVLRSVRACTLSFFTPEDPRLVGDALERHGLNVSDIELRALDHDEVPGALHQQDLAMFFVRPTYSKKGTCCTKLGEYLATGLPVVTNYGVGDHEEILRGSDCGVVVKGFQESDFKQAAESILPFVQNPAQTARNCRALAEKYFDAEDAAASYLAIYSSFRSTSR